MDELHYQVDLLKAMNQKLTVNERMLRMICSTSTNAFLYYDFRNKKVEVLGSFGKYFDFPINTVSDMQNIISCMKEDHVTIARSTIFAEERRLPSANAECCLQDGKTWLEFDVSVTYDDKDGSPVEKYIRIRDISKYIRQNEELKYLAYYDGLTGLFNRNYFVHILSEWVRKAETENALIAVMCVDIDDFKKVNDGLGLIYGDELVQNFGTYLSELENDNTIIARVNSDEYYIALYEPCGSRSVEAVLEVIERRTSQPFRLTNGNEIRISVSIGIAEYPEAGSTSLELLNSSEIVMFRAKAAGKNNVKFFEPPILTDFINSVNMENRLKNAIKNKSFELYFQPQYDSVTQKLRGTEALIRLHDDETNTLISPGLFIPIAERNGLIVPIGDWVVEEGIRIFSEWKKKYTEPLVLSLNISAIQYKKADFVHNLLKIIGKYKVNPEDIELEITESVLIEDFAEVVEKLHLLKEYGIRISLDDFGTGFSSLSYLKGLPIDTLKIDKSFIDTVTNDDGTRIITESIVTMVKRLGYETVAEGVETREQYEYLKDISCDNIQGFLLGRPMPANDFENLLGNNL